MPKVNPYISDQSAEFYSDHFRSRNAGCEFALDSWPALYKRTLFQLKKRFTAGELCLIVGVLNGTHLTAGIAGQHLHVGVMDAAELDGLDEKWGVDVEDIGTKIRGLTVFEAACIEVWASDSPADFEKYIETML